jgi:large subunit ribosomal protein L13
MMGRNQIMQTYSPRPRDIERRWYVVDADGAVLGRLASEVAKILRGKHKPIFAPHMDTGDHVIVVNARGIRVTGGKEAEKIAYHHSGYPGGMRKLEYTRLLSERPAVAVEKAIRGMLPKNRLGRQMLHKLAVYEGAEHPHQAQKPVRLGLGEIPKWEGLPKPKPQPAAPPKPSKARPATTAAKSSKGARPGLKRTAATAAARPARRARRETAGSAASPRRPAGTAAKAKEVPARRRKTAGEEKEAPRTAPRTRTRASGEAQAETEKPKRTARRTRKKKEQ